MLTLVIFIYHKNLLHDLKHVSVANMQTAKKSGWAKSFLTALLLGD